MTTFFGEEILPELVEDDSEGEQGCGAVNVASCVANPDVDYSHLDSSNSHFLASNVYVSKAVTKVCSIPG